MGDLLVTQEGYDKMVQELENLRTKKRDEDSARLRDAMEEGDDVLENAELEAAKNEQSFVEGRIKDLEYMIAVAHIAGGAQKKGEIAVGSVVDLQYDGESEVETYTIVGAPEADTLNNKISNESPLGKAIIGHRKGDKVSVSAANSAYCVIILKVRN